LPLLPLPLLLLQADAASGATFYRDLALLLRPATNYTALLAVRSSAFLAPSVTAVSGILTPDTQAPSFAAVALVNSSADATSFFLTLELSLDEPGFISYVVYRSLPCTTGEQTWPRYLKFVAILGKRHRQKCMPLACTPGSSLRPAPDRLDAPPPSCAGAPSVSNIRQRADLGQAACSCPPSLCTAAATGNLTLLDRTSDTFTLKGSLPPSPYEFLRNAQVSQLTCQPVRPQLQHTC
jgi:hypothetical protein